MVYNKILGSDNEININTSKPEFINWKWIEPRKLPEVIVSFKKIYTQIFLMRSILLSINFF